MQRPKVGAIAKWGFKSEFPEVSLSLLIIALAPLGVLVTHSYILNLILATVLGFQPALASDNEKPLKIGSPAPSIEIAHWLSDGNGKFKHIQQFESGKVYIVEFWATWCGPCIQSMPMLAEIQKKYAEQGLQIISISDEDLDTVNAFLEGNVRGKETSYAELTSAYCLTTDPDQSVFNDYMEASGQDGIPTAFLVGKTGEIEFIGHPLEMEEPLKQILADKWDREAFLKQQEEKAKLDQTLQQGMRKLRSKLQSGDMDGAIEVADALIKENKDNAAGVQFKGIRVQLLMQKGGAAAAEAFVEFATENQDDPQLLNEMAWTVVEMKQANAEQADAEILNAAIKTAKMALKNNSNDAMILDTLGHLLYYNGDLDEAIKVQRLAVENAGEAKADIEPLLKKMLAEKEAAEEAKKKSQSPPKEDPSSDTSGK